MINARVIKFFRLDRKEYRKGDRITLPENQFNDLAGVGLVERGIPAPPPRFVGRARAAANRNG
jgi:hypothetical protein